MGEEIEFPPESTIENEIIALFEPSKALRSNHIYAALPHRKPVRIRNTLEAMRAQTLSTKHKGYYFHRGPMLTVKYARHCAWYRLADPQPRWRVSP